MASAQAPTRVEARPIPKSDTHAESAQIETVSGLPRDLAVIKMQDDQIMSMAAARPRDEAAILKKISTQLSVYRDFAEEAIYSKPVGKDPQTGKMKYARGLSIRSAEALKAAFGYCKASVSVEPIGDDEVRITARFFDYQTCNVWEDQGILSKWYKTRDGQRRKHDDDRFFNVVVKAEASRRIREATLRSIDPGLRSELMRRAEEQVAAFLDDKAVGKIVTQFNGIGVTKEMLETFLGKRLDAIDQEDRKNLLGVWNSIRDGETTAAEAFGDPDKEAAKNRTDAQAQALSDKLKKNGSKAGESAPGATSYPENSAAAPPPSPSSEPTREPVADDMPPPADGAPDLSKAEQITLALAERHSVTTEKAKARLDAYCNNLFKKPLASVKDPKTLDGIMANVQAGEIVV